MQTGIISVDPSLLDVNRLTMKAEKGRLSLAPTTQVRHEYQQLLCHHHSSYVNLDVFTISPAGVLSLSPLLPSPDRITRQQTNQA